MPPSTLSSRIRTSSEELRVFRGRRVPFQALLEYLEGGQPLDEFLDDFPTVTKEAAVGALELAKSLVVSQG